MPDLAWMKLYVDDWVSSPRITMMSDAEERAYMRLLMWQWKAGSVPSEPEKLARILQRPVEEAARLWDALADLFPEGQNEKCARVREEQIQSSRRASEKGRRGAQARWNAQADAQAYAQADARAMGAQGPGPRAQNQGSEPLARARTRAAPAVDNSPVTRPEPAEPARGGAPPDSVHGLVVQAWSEAWEEVRGEPYALAGPDHAGIKRLRTRGDPDEIHRRAVVMLTSPDEWVLTRASPGLLYERWNNYAGHVDPVAVRQAKAGKGAWRRQVEIVP